ncbi:MAG: hypothetical protein LUG60_04710 [Erysipelotrichaceae bacterium]|nr:hypothetical protein [Erysipelotrichaceae bacterium]
MLRQLIIIRIRGMFSRILKNNHNHIINFLYGLLFVFLAISLLFSFSMMFLVLVEDFRSIYFIVMAIMAFMLMFVGSIFLTYHEIYNVRDNELLLSMPISNIDIVLSRLFALLILNYAYEFVVCIPAWLIYLLYYSCTITQMIIFIIVILTLPLLVLTMNCIISWFIGYILIHIKHKNLIEGLLTLIFIIAYIFGMGYINTIFTSILNHMDHISLVIKTYLFPFYHLNMAIEEENMISFIIYLLCMIIPFIITIYLLSTNFIKIVLNKPIIKKKTYKSKSLHQKPITIALIYKDIKHYFNHFMILLNSCAGNLLTIILIFSFFCYQDDFNEMKELFPLIQDYMLPMIVFILLIGSLINTLSASSVSLEGQNFWIIKSLPISYMHIINAKILVHLILCTPFLIALCVILYVILPITLYDFMISIFACVVFNLLSATLGLLLNLWKPRFDWVNETMVVKQSMPVTLMVLTGFALAIIIVMLYIHVFINCLDIKTYTYDIIGICLFLDALFYCVLQKWGVKRLYEI